MFYLRLDKPTYLEFSCRKPVIYQEVLEAVQVSISAIQRDLGSLMCPKHSVMASQTRDRREVEQSASADRSFPGP